MPPGGQASAGRPWRGHLAREGLSRGKSPPVDTLYRRTSFLSLMPPRETMPNPPSGLATCTGRPGPFRKIPGPSRGIPVFRRRRSAGRTFGREGPRPRMRETACGSGLPGPSFPRSPVHTRSREPILPHPAGRPGKSACPIPPPQPRRAVRVHPCCRHGCAPIGHEERSPPRIPGLPPTSCPPGQRLFPCRES